MRISEVLVLRVRDVVYLDFVDSCDLQDLGFSGLTFTWQRGGTFVRLDQALANDAWMTSFPQPLVSHLPHIKFDHQPIFLSTRPGLNMDKGRPFRFLADWTKHNNFSTFVKYKWNFASNMVDSLNKFTLMSKIRTMMSMVSWVPELITNEEIKRALFDMGPLKAPGSDGFHAHFFQSQWDLLGNDICNISMTAVGIPDSLRKVIMSAISSASMQILWNGVPTRKFKSTRGIRQGCPLSPYLFVLCIDWLGHFIRSDIDIGRWKPIQLSITGLLISHLFFADNLVIFCKA
ncbi:LINE-type retrotransposon LIb DNA, Insertion at the S11 site-like protein [Gossypium australe]|uniref:LINE-type retrotransposon LIb DNA, Insertion at the S11 site-like protein n=1 Tax=Gossypium australe TaxID=47621 RepID=A0A5B6URV5_9ROSI|nr:LINE-type retrotransposon LIb DNA, Insertion at the S11 site-like protein [Gossypium australe]